MLVRKLIVLALDLRSRCCKQIDVHRSVSESISSSWADVPTDITCHV